MAEQINEAFDRVPNMTERLLADMTGISQPTINRIKSGKRVPKINELMAIAAALGCSLGELTGESPVASRLVCAARSTGDGATARMQSELSHYFELDAYLLDQGYAVS